MDRHGLWPHRLVHHDVVSNHPLRTFCHILTLVSSGFRKRSGSITVETSGNTINAVAGNVTSWGVGFLMAIVLTFAFPAKRSSTDARHVERSNKIQGIAIDTPAADTPPNGEYSSAKDEEKAGSSPPMLAPEPEAFIPTGNEIVDFLEAKHMEPMDPVAVKKAERIAIGANVIFGVVAILLVPFTLFGTGYIYSKAFFTGWVSTLMAATPTHVFGIR